jgi:hypothetical protein
LRGPDRLSPVDSITCVRTLDIGVKAWHSVSMQATAPLLKNGRTYLHKCGTHAGCSCCNTKAVRRVSKKSAKAREERAWRRENT